MAFDDWKKRIENPLDGFENITGQLDDRIYKKLLGILAKLDSDKGKLKPQKLARIFKEIDLLFETEFKNVNYKEKLLKIHDLVNNIVDANIIINRDLNNIKLSAPVLIADTNLALYTETLVTSLSDLGIRENVILPVKQLINAAVIQGKGTGALVKQFENLFTEGSEAQLTDIRGRSLLSYAKQITNDVTNAANGQIQTHLRDKFGLNGLRYIGNTIRDSRPFCVHMLKDEKMPMSFERLREVLKEYVGSKVHVEINGKLKEKGAGMYANTTVENFPLVLGGYNCRHRMFATKVKPSV